MVETTIVVAVLTPLPEKQAEVMALILDLIPRVHGETENVLFTINAEIGGERLVFVEKYQHVSGAPHHLDYEHTIRFHHDIRALLADEMDVVVLEPLSAGDPQRGVL